MRGSHLLRHWCGTQATVALSSGEAELIAIVRAAAEGLSMRSIVLDVGIDCNIEVCSDASAALGICKRSGIGKVRHLDTGLLWVQEKVKSRDIAVQKIPGSQNPADCFTKYLTSENMLRGLHRMRCWPHAGRAECAPGPYLSLTGGPDSKETGPRRGV